MFKKNNSNNSTNTFKSLNTNTNSRLINPDGEDETVLPKKHIYNGSFCIWNTDTDNAYNAAQNVQQQQNGNPSNTGPIGPTGPSTLSAITLTEGTSIPSATNVDDFALSNNSFFKITGSIAGNINGFANGVSGRLIIIINNTTGNQTFKQEQTTSLASNRSHLFFFIYILLPKKRGNKI